MSTRLSFSPLAIASESATDHFIEIVNLTPHAINIMGKIEVPPSGIIARCDESSEPLDHPFPQVRITMGEPYNVPEPRENTLYVTSRIVAEKLKRPDVISPASLIRNESGQVIGCAAFARFD
jgi:hypothetical protein